MSCLVPALYAKTPLVTATSQSVFAVFTFFVLFSIASCFAVVPWDILSAVYFMLYCHNHQYNSYSNGVYKGALNKMSFLEFDNSRCQLSSQQDIVEEKRL